MTRMTSPPPPRTFIRGHPCHPRFINFPFEFEADDCWLTDGPPGGAMGTIVRRDVSATSSARSITLDSILRRGPLERYTRRLASQSFVSHLIDVDRDIRTLQELP